MKKLICLGLACGWLAACSTTPFGPPDDPSKPIPPAGPNPFDGSGSGASATPWSGNTIDSLSAQPGS